ncbi:peptidylprolyl isomerase [Paenibacillus sp. GCM10027627]|uniref:peptidylprolyl isomerase n=1 Tax=unclassified Paenibacillus TaxID=185978 RepID=UPI003627CB63
MNNKESQQPNEKPQDNDSATDNRNTTENEHIEEQAHDLAEQQDSQEEAGLDKPENEESDRPATAATPYSAASTAAIGAAAPPKKSSLGWIILSALLAAALIIVLVIKPPFGGNEAIATVNGTKITKDELYEKLVKGNGESAMENLILEKLVEQEIKAASISFTEEDITQEIEILKLNFPTIDAFNEALAQNGFTEEDLREDFRLSAMVRKVLEPKSTVTDEAVQEYFDANQGKFGGSDEQIRASHILVKTKEEADAIYAELKAGKDFAELAKAKSTDGSAEKGGDLDFFGKGAMVAEFEQAAFALEVGAISEPVKSEFGYHIIKKTDYKAGTPASEDKKSLARAKLVADEVNQTLASPWLEEIKAKAKIENTLAPKETTPASEPPAAEAPASEVPAQ